MKPNSIGNLTGHKCRLIGLKKSIHLPLCMAWMNDVEVTKYLKMNPPVHETAEEMWFSKLGQNPNEVTFGIETLQGEYVGNISLHRINWEWGTAASGTVIGSKAHWGQGIGTDAKMLLLDYAFHWRKLQRVGSRVYSFNERSLNCQLTCGYKQEGVVRREIFKRGEYYDTIVLGVLKEEWEPVWDRYQKTGKTK